MTKPSPSSLAAEGIARREDAIQRVADHASPDWKAAAFQAVAGLARRQRELTTDDVWGLVDAETHEPRAMGAIMRQAASAGLIESTDRYRESYRPACHRRPLRVWRSLLL